jgi:hypothetical protein
MYSGTGPGSAIDHLIFGENGLNAALRKAGKEPYAIVAPPRSPFGADAIQVGLIYRPSRLQPVGGSLTDLSSFDTYNRPPLAQLFSDRATGARFWIVANHFKSKGPRDATGPDVDQNDGQGAWNFRRKAQAVALLNFLQTALAPACPDILVIGDLNCYAAEDPLNVLRAGGLTDLIAAEHPAEEPYSFLFNGQVGRLDQAFATPGLAARLTGAAEWHVNADEPAFLDYKVRLGDHADSPLKPGDHYQPNPFRYSDHDPILLGFDLGTKGGQGKR